MFCGLRQTPPALASNNNIHTTLFLKKKQKREEQSVKPYLTLVMGMAKL